jgi:hypothetical protein
VQYRPAIRVCAERSVVICASPECARNKSLIVHCVFKVAEVVISVWAPFNRPHSLLFTALFLYLRIAWEGDRVDGERSLTFKIWG